MQDSLSNLETNQPEIKNSQSPNNRRAFLGRVATTGMGLAMLRLISPEMSVAQAATMPNQPAADSGHGYPMAKPKAQSEKDFRMGVIGPAVLSHLASEIAVDKATDPMAQEFANFELREAIGVLMVLRDLGTPTPPMSSAAKGILKQIKDTPPGAEFDKAYMKAQLSNHEFLRDLANTYLANSTNHKSMAEKHGRHLATLTLGVFKEHVVHCKDFLKLA